MATLSSVTSFADGDPGSPTHFNSKLNTLVANITAINVGATFFYNVKDYGALGNGVTDDTTAIQATINAAAVAGEGGGVVVFPSGKFPHTGLTGAAGVTLKGAGPDATYLWYTPTTGNAITLGADPDWFTLADMTVHAATSSSGWVLASPTGITREVTVRNVNTGGFLKGLQLNGALNCHVEHVRLNGRGKSVVGGIMLECRPDLSARSSNGLTVISAYINTSETGCDLECGYVALVRPIFEDNGTSVVNRGIMSAYMPWQSEAGPSTSDLDFNLTTPALLIGYGSGSWKLSYANSTVQDRTIVIPERLDRLYSSASTGGPSGIKLGKVLIDTTGTLYGVLALSSGVTISGSIIATDGIGPFFRSTRTSTNNRFDFASDGTNGQLVAQDAGEWTCNTTFSVASGVINTKGFQSNVTIQSGNYTATINDYTVSQNSTSTTTVTLPAASTVTGQIYNVHRMSTGTVVIQATSGSSLNGSMTTNLVAQYQTLTFQSYGTGYLVV